MEHIFNLIEVDSSNSRIKVSITESTMMQILHSSMDKAYRKVKSKNGVLERLNEISKFYELAVMQLEGCLKFVQEETGNYDLESSQELLLEDLTEIRDRLQGRLKEVELAISDKDKELLERLGNELKLRKALEINEKKMDSLYADLKLEQRKSEGIEEFFLSNQTSIENGDREGEFCELKHSVDQQVLNIQQQLEPNNKKIDQMGSDIGILKETLDLAFCKMQNAIFLSELGPIEHQWMFNIERNIAAIVIKGFSKDFRENFEDELKKRELQVSFGLRNHLSDVIKEITCLNHELQLLSNQEEVQVKSKGRCLSEGHNLDISNNLSLNVEEASTMKRRGEEDSEDDGSHYVAKMIKNHESKIRRKSEELDLLARELLREKPCLPLWKEKDSVDPKRRIQEVIMRLESLIKWNPRIGDIFGDNRYDYELQKQPEVRLFTDDQMDSMEEIWAKVNKNSVFQAGNEEQCSQMKILKQEMEDANLQNMIMEEIYLTLFRSLVDEFHIELLNHHLHCLIKEGMYENFIEEMKNDTVFAKATKDLDSANYQNAKAGSNLEGMVEEDVYTFLLQEILREWDENIETFKSISSLREELCFVVFGETIRDVMKTSNSAISKLKEIKVDDSLNYDFEFDNKFFESTAAMSIKDDILKVFLADMIKELQMKTYDFSIESLIREEVFQFVIVEAVKEGCCILEESDDRKHQEQSSNNSLISVDNLTHTLDKLVKFLEEEEALILSACSEMKQQQKTRLNTSGFDEFSEGHEHFLGLFSTNSADSKLEKALQQLDFVKAQLSELGSQLGITVGNLEQMTPLIATKYCRKPSIYESKDNIKEIKMNIYESLLTPIQELSQTLKTFEFESCTRLGNHVLRLDEMKFQLDLLVELTPSLVQKELLYRKAFIRRCENLQMAEAEVDLLGDQVDKLLGLLKKIYMTLHQHSPVFQQYFEVSEMLKLIEKEIGGR